MGSDFVGIEILEREYAIASELQDKYEFTTNDDNNLCAGNGVLIEDEDELKDMIAAYLSEHGDDGVDTERIIACIKQAAEDKTE
jgi:hypothetical protein